MALKPQTKLNWVPTNDPTKVIEPAPEKKAQGWFKEEKPPFQYFNWAWNLIDKWINYLEATIETHTAANNPHGIYQLPAGTVQLFGQATAPTGWTRKTDWQDNAMLCVSTAGAPTSGGTANPQSTHGHSMRSHTHAGPNHRHNMGSHVHVAPAHTHGSGSLRLKTGALSSNGGLMAYNSTGGTIVISNAQQLGVGGNSYYFLHVAGAHKSLSLYTNGGTGVTSSAGASNTGAPSTNYTGYSGTGATGAPSVANTGSNSAPLYQEVIAATKN